MTASVILFSARISWIHETLTDSPLRAAPASASADVVEDRWTCIGAWLELYQRLGVQTNAYGTGLLGFGTTLFDPIMPVRFLSDPFFRLLSRETRPKPDA